MKVILTILLTISFITSYSQEGEDFSCKCCNSSLKALLEGKTVEQIYVHYCGSGTGSGGLASSFLMPTGTAPKVVEVESEAPDYTELEKWTCRYAPGLITDGDTKTAWVEGAKDYGIGELVITSCIDLKRPVQIWAGYGKSPSIFTQNSRPKKVRVLIIQINGGGPTQYGSWYNNLKVIKQADVDLKDLNGFQPLTMPAFISSSFGEDGNVKGYNYFLGIVILDVYKGTKYSDTCISEISNIAASKK